ncbi:hypothetical protein JHK82_043828 [Glycine max]|nr:hypothetical protein JHK86_043710 [Glycine max]KAG4957997.1 hypothetical protein JHK85_044377 [Glycine max]KAG5106858.1 hypothetical protein JHK82_043828 [Glycine max]KAG5117782.1 hypothetical protein JHK84_043895 [Glycine max]
MATATATPSLCHHSDCGNNPLFQSHNPSFPYFRDWTFDFSSNLPSKTKYKDSAYVFVGGIPFDLIEGDLLTVFAQYGEVIDVNLVRDKGTRKSKGFAFLAYED